MPGSASVTPLKNQVFCLEEIRSYSDLLFKSFNAPTPLHGHLPNLSFLFGQAFSGANLNKTVIWSQSEKFSKNYNHRRAAKSFAFW